LIFVLVFLIANYFNLKLKNFYIKSTLLAALL
jgi:hypothetical protein